MKEIVEKIMKYTKRKEGKNRKNRNMETMIEIGRRHVRKNIYVGI